MQWDAGVSTLSQDEKSPSLVLEQKKKKIFSAVAECSFFFKFRVELNSWGAAGLSAHCARWKKHLSAVICSEERRKTWDREKERGGHRCCSIFSSHSVQLNTAFCWWSKDPKTSLKSNGVKQTLKFYPIKYNLKRVNSNFIFLSQGIIFKYRRHKWDKSIIK